MERVNFDSLDGSVKVGVLNLILDLDNLESVQLTKMMLNPFSANFRLKAFPMPSAAPVIKVRVFPSLLCSKRLILSHERFLMMYSIN